MNQLRDSRNLKNRRKQARLSQWCVARALGKSQGWLSNIENFYVMPSEKILTDIFSAIERLKQDRN